MKADKGYIGHQAAKMMKRSKNIERRQLAHIEQKQALLKDIEEDEDLKLSPLTFHTNKLVELCDVSAYYDGRKVFDDISFSIMAGDRIAIRGANGSGKSTLLKICLLYKSRIAGRRLF